ncbi:polynucleotide kinase [Legionella massiliensis]|uniref:Polynucleotide kinase n=1 Tax=Legionella massiliensis TaxID=1034943 RepID=A0A078KS34_9GAMM|nr:AAA family ATPase [Legionella massiliensis]CDZ75782.1 polynucleotide kinase [Legionella massiliensis]CEE11520.1 Adenylyl-sulfate kinase [Legionella massiliensis]
MNEPILIIFGGLPGTGKTTLSKELAKQLKAVYLRVDTIEQALINVSNILIGPEGYLISYALAQENLRLGLSVVADSVNPIELTRKDWQEVARSMAVKFVEIEIVCSDSIEHKRRVETRSSDIVGHRLPTWDEVKTRDYEQWDSVSLRIDTAEYSPDEAIKKIRTYIEGINLWQR